jgi:small neutral amino acid transporter SnatA (MarC family)
MSLLIGGIIAAIFGLFGLVEFGDEFLTMIKGSLPVFLILGGALAIYVGLDELQEKNREERQRQEEKLEKTRRELDAIKAQAESYKEELNKLKESKQ